MFAMTRPRMLVAVIVGAAGLASAALLALVAFTSTAEADHAWKNYHWASEVSPFTLKTGDNVDSNWDAYLDEAISDWNNRTDKKLALAEVTGGTNPKNCRPTSGRIEVCNAKYGNNGWLGLAQIWASGDHITQAVSKLNDSYFNMEKYNKPEWRRMVMCQEIAHDFGLGHQDETFDNENLGSCMDYTGNPLGPPSNEHPNLHDFDQLDLIYKHQTSDNNKDSTTTVGATAASKLPPAANQIDPNNAREWGRLVHKSPDGKLQIWERDFGNDQKMITFVKKP